MNTFYLQSDGKNSIIDIRVHDGYSLRADPIQAASWIDAKQRFGFELTELQSSILKRCGIAVIEGKVEA